MGIEDVDSVEWLAMMCDADRAAFEESNSGPYSFRDYCEIADDCSIDDCIDKYPNDGDQPCFGKSDMCALACAQSDRADITHECNSSDSHADELDYATYNAYNKR